MLLNKKNDWIVEKQINLVGQFSKCFYFFIFSDLRKRLHAISLLTFNLSQKRSGCMSGHCDCDCVWYKPRLHFFEKKNFFSFFFKLWIAIHFRLADDPSPAACSFGESVTLIFKLKRTDRQTDRQTVEGHGYNRWSTKVCTIITVYVHTYSGTNCHWIKI
jgi:hypothetical protein